MSTMKSEPAESAQPLNAHVLYKPEKGLSRCLNCGLSETYWERFPKCRWGAASQPTQPEGMRSVWGLHCNISSSEPAAEGTTAEQPEPTLHDYISTACQHGKHDQCRLFCKFCQVPCSCTECIHVGQPVAAIPTAANFYEANATNMVNVPRPGHPEDKSGWDGVRRASEARFIAQDALVMTLPDAFDFAEKFGAALRGEIARLKKEIDDKIWLRKIPRVTHSDQKWIGIVAKKDAEIERLTALLNEQNSNQAR